MTSTALAIKVIKTCSPPANRAEFDKRIAAAREFLRNVSPRTNEERTMRLLGLEAARASRTEVAAAAEALIASQHADGGWAQLDTLESDAYAADKALYALRTAGGVSPGDAVYRRGAAYLLRTQEADGSWYRLQIVPIPALQRKRISARQGSMDFCFRNWLGEHGAQARV